MKRWLFAAVLVVFASFSSLGLTNKVLIIGIDGTMCSALAVARTPNLDLLKSNGCYSVRAVTHPVTHSAACWSSMFTGVWGDKHLVNDPGNSFSGNNLATYPSFFKRLETANSNLNTLCFARWSPLLTVVPDADVKLAFSTDAEVTAETCRRLTNSNPDVFYMILLDVDSAGHSYGWGPNVTNYVKAIETADGRVGQIMKALEARPSYANENWLVIALTDHGEHDHPDPERSRITWHIVSGPSAAVGVMWPSPAIVDIFATVLTHMNVTIDPAWSVDARVEGLPLRPTQYGTNIVFNGDAEANSGSYFYTTNRGVAWWFDVSSTSLGTYGGNAAFPSPSSPGPTDRGSNFFLGGVTNGYISQRISVADIEVDLEDPGVDYRLSGWFGGAGLEEDYSQLQMLFLNRAETVLGQTSIGGLTSADRGGITGLQERAAVGTVPPGTRFIELVLTNHVQLGYNDASADNLQLVFTPKVDAPFEVSLQRGAPLNWSISIPDSRTNRVYVLERSLDCLAWLELPVRERGTGAALSLQDTNAPPGMAYYRASCRRP